MPQSRLLSQVTHTIVSKALSQRIQRLAEKVRANGGQPLDLVFPDGSRLNFGEEPRVVMEIRDPDLLPELTHPTLGSLGEAFVDGRIDIDGDIMTVIACAERLVEAGGSPITSRISPGLSNHTPDQDLADIKHHYDVGNEFYSLWLDERMVYSCAYFETGEETIDEAQRHKLDHICRKLRLQPGERFLDIGCGWGGLILYAAQQYGVQTTGITLSDNQFALAKERIRATGLNGRVEVILLDYRDALSRFGSHVRQGGERRHVRARRPKEFYGLLRRRAAPVARSKYLPETDPLCQMTDGEVVDFTLEHLSRMFPDLTRNWLHDAHVWRVQHSQPIVERQYSQLIPSNESPLVCIYVATMAQIYPEDRGTNYAIGQGQSAARVVAVEARKR